MMSDQQLISNTSNLDKYRLKTFSANLNQRLSVNSSVCSMKFKFEADEKSKPQNNCLF